MDIANVHFQSTIDFGPMSEQNSITVTFPDKQTASRIVDLVVRNKPSGWGRKSFASYYNEHYALQLKRELDAMIASKKSRMIGLGTKIKSSRTMYLLVNQSWRYLIDHLDPDGIYGKHLCNTIRQIKHGHGVAIYWKDQVEIMSGEEIGDIKEQKKWKRQVDDYLGSDETAPLHIAKVVLTPEEVDQLKAELDDLEGSVLYSVTCKEIKICKVGEC